MTICQTFEALKRRNEAALIAYTMAGFPTLDRSMECVEALCAGGADLVEIGVPFSDPIADGPAIQHAGIQALKNGVHLRAIIESARSLRTDKPLLLMSYLNPLLAYGTTRAVNDMKQAGFSGLIVPDLPVDEAEFLRNDAEQTGLDMVFLATPVTDDSRLRLIADRSQGFLYCVSLTGTTGMRDGIDDGLPAFLTRVRSATDKPVAVGFGVSTPQQVRQLSVLADGVIVGSRIVEAVRKEEDLEALVGELKKATKR